MPLLLSEEDLTGVVHTLLQSIRASALPSDATMLAYLQGQPQATRALQVLGAAMFPDLRLQDRIEMVQVAMYGTDIEVGAFIARCYRERRVAGYYAVSASVLLAQMPPDSPVEFMNQAH